MASRIYVTDHDLQRLRALVDQHSEGRDGEAAERLGAELDRAVVVALERLPHDVVTLDSHVAYEDETTGARRDVTLVPPTAANISAGRLSVLAPIGAALLGLRAGDAIEWPLPDGRVAKIRVVSVAQPQPRASEHGTAA